MVEKLKDSGARIDYGEGRAVREPTTGKGSFQYISPIAIQRLIQAMKQNRELFQNVDQLNKESLIYIFYSNMYDLLLTNTGFKKEFDYMAYTLYCIMQLYELEYNGQIFTKEFITIPPTALKAVAVHYQQGSEKYAPYNWELGIYMSRCLDSAVRHFGQYLMGMTDEPHLAASIWNIFALLHYEITQPDMNDLHQWKITDGT